MSFYIYKPEDFKQIPEYLDRPKRNGTLIVWDENQKIQILSNVSYKLKSSGREFFYLTGLCDDEYPRMKQLFANVCNVDLKLCNIIDLEESLKVMDEIAAPFVKAVEEFEKGSVWTFGEEGPVVEETVTEVNKEAGTITTTSKPKKERKKRNAK